MVISKENGDEVTDPREIANLFNQYFCEVPTNLSSTIERKPNDDINMFQTLQRYQPLSFSPTNPEEVEKVIKSLDPKKAAGIDDINANIIRNSCTEIAPVIVQIFNEMIVSGVYPEKLKIQRTIPILKKGTPKKVENYRPIAILSVINKCFEKLIFARICQHLDELSFLYQKQFGFRRGVGTLEACIDLVNKICEDISRGQLVGGIFLDLAKAFDTIDHTILLKKLHLMGLSGSSLELLRSYLQNRKQVVCIEGATSCERTVNIGVPQGSVLGPLMFLIFINDFAQLPLMGELYLFADDSSIFYPGKNSDEIKRKMERDMVLIHEFFRLNRISMNVAKTKVMIFSTKRKKHDPIVLEFGQHEIEESENVKFLGIIIDRNLSWSEHCKMVLTKVSQGLGILNKFRFKFDVTTKKLIYFALIHSHLSYCTALWGASSLAEKIQVAQNKSLRTVYNVDNRSNRVELYLLADVLPLAGLYKKQVSTYIYKNKNVTDGVVKTFQNKYNTKGKRNLQISNNRLELTAQRISVNGSIMYNQLPWNIRKVKTLNSFITKLRRNLMEPRNLNDLLQMVTMVKVT